MSKKFLSNKYKKSISTPMGEVVELANKYSDIINLSLGDPDFVTDGEIIEKAFIDTQNGCTGYADSTGDPELIEEIKSFYNDSYKYGVNDGEVMSVVGACHGMYLALESIIDDGDEVIIPEPYFTPYYNQIELVRGVPVTVETKEEDGFRLKAENLEEVITEKTKAIVINSPNNPTGACLSKEDLIEISKVVIKYDLVVIADEVYSGFSFVEKFFPIGSLPGMKERTITLGSFSKDYAMTGWRIGYVIAEKYIIDCIRDINEGICFSAPSMSQRAAIHGIRNRDKILSPMAQEYKKRVEYAHARINKIPELSVTKPQGTFYLFVNIKGTGMSSVEYSKYLLEKSKVLVIPGIAFGENCDDYVRIACTVGVLELEEAFNRMESAVVSRS
ncbi:MAG: pyridoxal phosphate-dependent aminotransferase [Firmicutes bacterium]|jgi:aspartate/methionine/tyrosine aminotransferase|nr:pyridoxal phosphate-dependent aminotransferase [Bacillota bacterium]